MVRQGHYIRFDLCLQLEWLVVKMIFDLNFTKSLGCVKLAGVYIHTVHYNNIVILRCITVFYMAWLTPVSTKDVH